MLAICVGNEGLIDKHDMSDRYTFDQLKSAIDNVRGRSGKPTTTSQQWKSYDDPKLIDLCDFMFPTIHPFWEHVYEPAAGVVFTVDHLNTIKNVSGNKIVVAKEVGYPTGYLPNKKAEHPCTEATQAAYYVGLTKTPLKHAFCYFEAYCQDWKNYNGTEPFWGLFGYDRRPKPAMSQIKAVW